MNISLKNKIRLNVFLLLIPFMLMIYFYYHGVIRTADEKMKMESQKIVNNISELYIEEYIYNTEKDFNYLFEDITINDFYNVFEYSDLISKWETYRKINDDAWYVYFATKYDRLYVVPRWIEPPGYEITERPWYINAYSNPFEISWTQPYEEAVTKSLVVTAARLYRDSKGDVIGIGAIDLTLENLSNMLDKINVGEGAEVFILDKNGEIIAHPQYSRVWTKLNNQNLIENIYKKDSG
ncbi:MAG: hypothetical protein PWQ85_1438, partial [Geotoga sp.]|nr:hypothetical protein [Geotoga sp.]